MYLKIGNVGIRTCLKFHEFQKPAAKVQFWPVQVWSMHLWRGVCSALQFCKFHISVDCLLLSPHANVISSNLINKIIRGIFFIVQTTNSCSTFNVQTTNECMDELRLRMVGCCERERCMDEWMEWIIECTSHVVQN